MHLVYAQSMTVDILNKICIAPGDGTYFVSLHTNKTLPLCSRKVSLVDVKKRSYVKL